MALHTQTRQAKGLARPRSCTPRAVTPHLSADCCGGRCRGARCLAGTRAGRGTAAAAAPGTAVPCEEETAQHSWRGHLGACPQRAPAAGLPTKQPSLWHCVTTDQLCLAPFGGHSAARAAPRSVPGPASAAHGRPLPPPPPAAAACPAAPERTPAACIHKYFVDMIPTTCNTRKHTS